MQRPMFGNGRKFDGNSDIEGGLEYDTYSETTKTVMMAVGAKFQDFEIGN